MSETVTRIHIQGPPEATLVRIMDLAFDLPGWPKFLPHYRWVKVLDQEVHEGKSRLTVEMACWRHFGPIPWPLKWRSHLWVDRHLWQMRFHHIAGPATGMDVVWDLVPLVEGVEVTIRHELDLKLPLVRTSLGKWVVAEVFVNAVAGRTLACLKATVEAETDRRSVR